MEIMPATAVSGKKIIHSVSRSKFVIMLCIVIDIVLLVHGNTVLKYSSMNVCFH